MAERDEQIGRNVQTLRGRRSQADVADAMRARGHKWSQATVWSIEKGERPLRLSEALDLLDVLDMADVDLSRLTMTASAAQVETWVRSCQRYYDGIKDATRDFLDAQDALREAFDAADDDELEVVTGIGGVPNHVVAGHSVEGWLDMHPVYATYEVLAERAPEDEGGRAPSVPKPAAWRESHVAAIEALKERPGFTEPEERVADLLAEGLTSREIAERLSLAEKTVENYVRSILGKIANQARLERARQNLEEPPQMVTPRIEF